MKGWHLIGEDLGSSGEDWLNVDELEQGAYRRLAAEDRMDAHDVTDPAAPPR